MKRILAGIGWFVGIWIGLVLAMSIVVGIWATRSMPAGANAGEGMQAATAFTEEHAALFSALRWSIFLVSLLLAVIGTLKGILPGTKQKPAP